MTRTKTSRGRGSGPLGIIAVEFALTLLVLLPLAFAAGEFFRISFYDQTLARATHLAAVAAGRDPGACQLSARNGFAGDDVAAWLFDRDDDGRIGFVAGQGPDGSAEQEVRIDIVADDGDLSNGVVFNQALCGVSGSMIQVRSVIRARMPFGIGHVAREHVSWALNQT